MVGLLRPNKRPNNYSESTIVSEGFKGGTRGAPIMPRDVSLSDSKCWNGGQKKNGSRWKAPGASAPQWKAPGLEPKLTFHRGAFHLLPKKYMFEK